MTSVKADTQRPAGRSDIAATGRRTETRRRILYGLIALPPLVSTWLLYLYGVDVPFWDEWSIAELLQNIDSEQLTFFQLFSQHNEHRMLVPRVVQLAVAVSVGWDTRVMMWLTQWLLLAMMGACIILWRRSLDSRTPQALLAPVLVSVVLFSPAQHQNLFWGFQICFYVPAACLLASTVVTSSSRSALGPALAAAALLSTVATFSILPGLLTWPLAAIAVLTRHGFPSRSDVWKWLLWSICWLSIVALYFRGYHAPSHSPALLSPFAQPLTLLASVAACLGNPLTFGERPVRTAMTIGAGAAAAFFWLLYAVWRHRADAQIVNRAGPWIATGSFGLLTAVAIAVGRGGYGYVALLEPRYAALTAWLLIGVIMLAAVLRDRSPTAYATRGWVGVFLLIALLSAISFPRHLAAIRLAHVERLQSQAVYLFADAAPNGSPMVPPWLDWPSIRERLVHVEQAGWRPVRPAAARWNDDPGPNCAFGTVEFVSAIGPRVMAGGWAYLPTAKRPADAVLVTMGSSRRIVALQPPLTGRGDIGRRFATPNALVSGWLVDARLAGERELLEFWALDVEALQAYRLCASGT